MVSYPIFLKLEGRLVVVIGGGVVATRKITAMLPCKANILLIAPVITDYLRALNDEGAISWWPRCYASGDLAGATLVFAATGDPRVQTLVGEEARDRGILCNRANCAALSDFYSPAIHRQGDLAVALTTEGKAPSLLHYVKRQLASLGSLVQLARLIPVIEQERKKLKADLSLNPAQRYKLLGSFTKRLIDKEES